MSDDKRVCLAYSGGLDTSVILRYLINEGYTVVAYLGNVGQDEDWAAVEKKALALGAERMVIDDLQQEFLEELVFRGIQCNAIYEDRYLLGTSLARPVLARALVRTAQKYNCKILSHGCTGKGNDQVRFELAWRALDPTVSVIAPWRMPKFFNRFQGRQDLLKFAAENNIPVSSSPKSPWSLDANLAHTSAESGILEKPEVVAPKDVWTKSVDPLDAPDVPTKFSITFKAGIPIKLDVEGGETYTNSVELFKKLNEIAGANGVGRVDIVESRFIGLKSRGCYDAPAHTVLRLAHVDLEGMTVDSKVRSIMSWIGNEWSQCLYNGMYFSPERELLENSIIYSQRHVNGTVNMMVYKGAAHVLSRSAPDSNLYSEEQASMDTLEGFSPEDTSGFIAIQAIRLEKYGAAKIQHGEPLV
ncbi:Argininosuccinate synthase [Beauveria bassiana]|uniref:Argininosuccinate synthase n=1 Tax=Beauveria bassiana (strain ARSEF 2860) TaxID=655819 RepID=J4KKQ7_BEAB2|nr:argininosuccinate synthase [Beauveria bassiana ARSEF 2860]EJP60874.1 argininosuccinate synthase [Beauveria bassiana ARSEF 2860]KAH8721428.1 Argininosuccinate synthase [Beauveria bassiana]